MTIVTLAVPAGLSLPVPAETGSRALGADDPPPDVAPPVATLLGEGFRSAAASKKVGNSVDSEMFLNMTAKDTNALQQFFNFVNDIYLETIGGAKI